jgi:hypothetical protein
VELFEPSQAGLFFLLIGGAIWLWLVAPPSRVKNWVSRKLDIHRRRVASRRLRRDLERLEAYQGGIIRKHNAEVQAAEKKRRTRGRVTG